MSISPAQYLAAHDRCCKCTGPVAEQHEAVGQHAGVRCFDGAAPGASCKPFSKNRAGVVLGEGAAIVLLEPMDEALARKATIHGELIGYGLTTDSSHIARPSAQGQAAAMRAALRSAGITAQTGEVGSAAEAAIVPRHALVAHAHG